MGMDLDYIAAKYALERLKQLLADTPHGEREEIADDIIALVTTMEEKYKNKFGD